MKKIKLLILTILTSTAMYAQFSYTTIKAEGFETTDGLPETFTRTGQAAWSTAIVPYTGGFWDLIFASATPKDYVVSAYTSDFQGGAQCIQINTNTATVALRIRSITGSAFNPSIGEWSRYKVSLWAKGTAGSQIFDDLTQLATGGWDKYEFIKDYSTGLSETRLMLDLKATGGTATTIYIDDVLVEKYNQADPVTVAATAVNETSFTANWNVMSGATAYKLTLQTSIDGSTWITVIDYPKTITGNTSNSEVITGLTNNTQYRYKVEGFDGTYYSPASNYTTVTTSSTTSLSKTSIQSVIAKNSNLKFELSQAQSVEILNINGQCLLKTTAAAGQNTIPIAQKGVFILKVGAEKIKFSNY